MNDFWPLLAGSSLGGLLTIPWITLSIGYRRGHKKGWALGWVAGLEFYSKKIAPEPRLPFCGHQIGESLKDGEPVYCGSAGPYDGFCWTHRNCTEAVAHRIDPDGLVLKKARR